MRNIPENRTMPCALRQFAKGGSDEIQTAEMVTGETVSGKSVLGCDSSCLWKVRGEKVNNRVYEVRTQLVHGQETVVECHGVEPVYGKGRQSGEIVKAKFSTKSENPLRSFENASEEDRELAKERERRQREGTLRRRPTRYDVEDWMF